MCHDKFHGLELHTSFLFFPCLFVRYLAVSSGDARRVLADVTRDRHLRCSGSPERRRARQATTGKSSQVRQVRLVCRSKGAAATLVGSLRAALHCSAFLVFCNRRVPLNAKRFAVAATLCNFMIM